MFTWQVVDVSSWRVTIEEVRGLRVKHWLQAPDGSLWLRKEPRAVRPYEPAIELLMLQLAANAGLSVADGAACEWVDAGQAKRGLVVRSFVDRARQQLVSGAVLLSRHDERYEPDVKWQHTLERVRVVLARQEAAGGKSLLVDFARMLAFDAWIGNGDRHQENWGILLPEEGNHSRLAPMYDPAACLGTELQDGHRQLDPLRRTGRDLEFYIQRCPSGFGDGTGPISLAQLIETLQNWPEWQHNARSWVAAFRNTFNTLIQALPNIESSWLPEHRKIFVTTVLEQRLTWLEKSA